jgi:regulator of sigma E protease
MISSILILVVAFLSLIALMIVHEFGHFIIAKKFGVRVDEFGIGYPPRLFGKKIGETIYSINLLPLGAFVRIYGEEGGVDDYRSFANLKIWQRALIVVGGVVAFWIAAIIIFSVVFAMGADIPIGDQDVSDVSSAKVKVVMVSQDSPAGMAGIKITDTIKEVKVEDSVIQINKISEFQKVSSENKGKEIIIVVDRNGEDISFNLTPRVSPPAGEGSVGIGLERMATLIKKSSWYMAPVHGVTYTWQTTIDGLKGFYLMFSNFASGKGAPEGSSFLGPLGITVFLANAASYGIGFFLYFIGIISVFIAIFNLFPIPALDGGKLIFLLIEKITKKPVPAKIEQSITVVFFFILIILSIFITIKFDIPRFVDFFKSALQR